MARLISVSAERLSSEWSWEPTLTEETALKWALGRDENFPLTLMFWQWLRADTGWQWRDVRPLMKGNREICDWLAAHLWGRFVDGCLPPGFYCTDQVIRIHRHAHHCVCTQRCHSAQLTVSTFAHSNFNVSQSSQSTRHFVQSGIFLYVHWNASPADYIVIFTSDTIWRNYNLLRAWE